MCVINGFNLFSPLCVLPYGLWAWPYDLLSTNFHQQDGNRYLTNTFSLGFLSYFLLEPCYQVRETMKIC